MGFAGLVLLETVLCLTGGAVFMAGKKGIALAVVCLSLLNITGVLFFHAAGFWLREILILLSSGAAVVLLNFFNRRAQSHHMVMGLTGGIISLVLFGAFLSPLAAVIVWILVIGAGLIPRQRKNAVFWGILPTAFRCLLGIGVVIGGNGLI